LERIRAERQRQADLPGSEWDAKNTPGDWVAIISHYVSSEVRRNGINPEASEFEDNFVKAAAVILAALENLPAMKQRGELL
jgi:aminoglycoside phosphotransferase (APT) family kinase protein